MAEIAITDSDVTVPIKRKTYRVCFVAALQIIVEDCMLTMKKFTSEQRKVDYVFGDLTDIPISDAGCSELWEFMINILRAAFDILRPAGKFMTHVSLLVTLKITN